MSKQLKTHRFFPSFDRLESRTVLTGDVSISARRGLLTILGDVDDNQLSIVSNASNQVTVTSLDGTTTLNGQEGPLTFSNIRKGMSIRLGDGDDMVELTNFRAQDDVSINLGNGNNTLTATNVFMRDDDLVLTSGSGDDVFTLTNVFLSKDELRINTGGGNDDVLLENVFVDRDDTNINLNSGDDRITILSSSFRKLMLSTGSGDDQVNAADSVFGKKSSLQGGSGDDIYAAEGISWGKNAKLDGFETKVRGLAPLTGSDAATVPPGGSVDIDVTANDATLSGTLDLASLTIVEQPTSGTVTVNPDGTVTYLNTDTSATSDVFTYTIADDLGRVSRETTVAVTISDTTTANPIAGDDTATITSGASTTINLAANDSAAVGQTLDLTSIAIVNQPTSGSVTVNPNGTVTYTNTNTAATSDTFTYTILDNSSNISNIATVLININAAGNQPPVANNDTFSLTRGTTLSLAVLANDTDANNNLDPASVMIVQQPTQGTVLVNPNGTVTYFNNVNSLATDVFTYTVADSNGSVSNTATVNLTING